MQKIIIIDNTYGQLGNTLYKLSNLIAFAIDNKVTVWDCSMYSTGYEKLFPNINNRLLMVYPYSIILPFNVKILHYIQFKTIRFITYSSILKNSGILKIHRPKKTEFSLNIKNLYSPPDVHTVVLRGFHYIADGCLRNNADYIRWLFTPTKDIVSIAKNQFSRLVSSSDIVVAVHIRQGDFKEWNDGKYFFDMTYYAKAMKRIEKLLPHAKVRFILFSDDKNLNLSAFEGFNYVLPESISSISYDWYLMSLCYFIIAPLFSTYSGWASFYGKTPIYRLNGRNCPQSVSEFIFEPILNNSEEHNTAAPTDTALSTCR